jgi:hypothetical protein
MFNLVIAILNKFRIKSGGFFGSANISWYHLVKIEKHAINNYPLHKRDWLQ